MQLICLLLDGTLNKKNVKTLSENCRSKILHQQEVCPALLCLLQQLSQSSDQAKKRNHNSLVLSGIWNLV